MFNQIHEKFNKYHKVLETLPWRHYDWASQAQYRGVNFNGRYANVNKRDTNVNISGANVYIRGANLIEKSLPMSVCARFGVSKKYSKNFGLNRSQ